MRKGPGFLGSVLTIAVSLLLVAATAGASAPQRIELEAPFGDPLESGWVQTRFWERDHYKLKGATSNAQFDVGVYWWVDNTTCFGPPTQSAALVSLATNPRGAATGHYAYTGNPPAQMVGHVSGVRWILHLSGDRIYYTTPCTVIDLR